MPIGADNASHRHLERMIRVVSKTDDHSITIVGIALLAASRNEKGSLGRNTLGLMEVPFREYRTKVLFPQQPTCAISLGNVGWNIIRLAKKGGNL